MTDKNAASTDRTVESVMCKSVITATDSQSIVEAARLLVTNRVGAVPVVDSSGVCVGMLTAIDIVRFEVDRIVNDATDSFGLEATVETDDTGRLQIGIEPLDQVHRYMNRAVQTIDPNCSIQEAASMMRNERIHHLPILDDKGRPIGIISSFDLLVE